MPYNPYTMKRLLILLLGSFVLAACGDSNQQYVRKAIRIMDKNGIYAQGPAWEQAKQKALAAHPATLEEARQIVSEAGAVAGGKHTFLMTADKVAENDTSSWEMPTVEMTDNGIAIIKLPAFSGNAEEGMKYLHTVLDALPDTLRGAVIDLRDNRGGNMNPMLAAVHRFLPDDNILTFSSRKRPMVFNIDYILRTVGVDKQSPLPCPVALLINEWTGSSGEAVLISFRGMANTRTFGCPTAGFASCNQPYALPDGSSLVLTIGEDIARTGEVFCDDPIAPDVPTETPLEDALAWIESCR